MRIEEKVVKLMIIEELFVFLQRIKKQLLLW
mgnify:CR=1 FL=1